MYGEDVKNENGTYNYHLRLTKAREFFSKINKGKSLVFHYSNYSN
ncbi:unnamed protein product, partial [marine sediment metagenome]